MAVRNLFLTAILGGFLMAGCASQQTANPLNTLSADQQLTYHSVAQAISNPCAETALTHYQTLDELVSEGQNCHEAHILNASIQFYLSSGLDSAKTQELVQAGARALSHPADVRVENRPRLGQAQAPIEIVVFSDFQCPFCARAAQTMHKVYEARSQVVTVVFKQMPLTTIHPYAAAAALVTAYADSKGKFWEVHDRLFENQADITPTYLTQILEELGAKPEDVFDPVNGHAYGMTVMEDIEDAHKAGVEGTPSFYVNGVSVIGGGNYQRMIHYIDTLLSAPAPSSSEERQQARIRELEKCPYPGREEIYGLLNYEGREGLVHLANKVLCPCPATTSMLHQCASDNSCAEAGPMIDQMVTRILEKVPLDQLQAEMSQISLGKRTQVMKDPLLDVPF